MVTDGAGRFVLPELPAAEYKVWVRGYGLLDSEPVNAVPGATLELSATPAANAQQAAAIYPASYWLSLLEPPKHSADWTNDFKLSCQVCHQIGSTMTRALPNREAYDHGMNKAGWMGNMAVPAVGRDLLLDALAEWSARIRDGETPEPPPRPRGHRAKPGDYPMGLGRYVYLFPRRNRHRQARSHTLP